MGKFWSVIYHKTCYLLQHQFKYIKLSVDFIYCLPDIGIMVRVFTNDPGNLGSIPGWVIPKTQKMVLDAPLLNTQHYKVRIKGKVGNPGKGVAPSPTPWCSSYWKGSLRVTLNDGRQLYFTHLLWNKRKTVNIYVDVLGNIYLCLCEWISKWICISIVSSMWLLTWVHFLYYLFIIDNTMLKLLLDAEHKIYILTC